jgi:protoporphyrinogen oxidase
MDKAEQKGKALIIGAGPAGLTAAWEFVTRTAIRPLVFEKSDYIGGISRTVRYKNNRIDIGGHRFFSKSDRVMNWWRNIMQVQASADITYHGQTTHVAGSAGSADPDRVLLIRNRKSRIYFLRRFFDYPISLTGDTLSKLGIARTIKIGTSYIAAALHQIKPEKTLEQFLINRFGRELYLTFFKSYTEKVWGVPCHEISAEWGAQRIKGLSVTKAILHFFRKKRAADIAQKGTETSLIEKFMYPKYGPGQLWEYVAKDVQRMGGEIEMGWDVMRLHTEGRRVRAAEMVHRETGESRTQEADYFFSTMPVRELIHKMSDQCRTTWWKSLTA